MAVALDPAASPVTIGRDATHPVPIDDTAVSRLHAQLWFDQARWHLEDCGSRNGSWLNSQSVRRAPLASGDLIRVGDQLLVLLEETRGVTPSQISSSLHTVATTATRFDVVGRHDSLVQRLGHATDPQATRRLGLLCGLANSLHGHERRGELAKDVVRMLRKATDARLIHILVQDAHGRLTLLASNSKKPADTAAHLLASLAMQGNEALLTGNLGSTRKRADDEQLRRSIAVPIAGRRRPLGAVECLQPRSGAFDEHDLEFVVAVAHQLAMAMENLEHRHRLEQSNAQLRGQVAAETRLFGESPVMKELSEQLGRVGPTGSTVLITGESGTGKELVAHAIHRLSPRADGPFVAVNCAAFNDALLESELFGHEKGAFTGAERRRQGRFERAHRGTIFLDEVGEMSASCQAKLLRMLEGHPFHRVGGTRPIAIDVRVLAATHRDLRRRVGEGQFREDLYYRLRVIELSVPPLRERGDDIVRLAKYFLALYRRRTGRGPQRFSSATKQQMKKYAWPGNVRELKNAVERAVVLGTGDEIKPADLALKTNHESADTETALVTLAEVERRHIEAVLRATGGNKTKAGKILGIGRGTLYKKLEG